MPPECNNFKDINQIMVVYRFLNTHTQRQSINTFVPSCPDIFFRSFMYSALPGILYLYYMIFHIFFYYAYTVIHLTLEITPHSVSIYLFHLFLFLTYSLFVSHKNAFETCCFLAGQGGNTFGDGILRFRSFRETRMIGMIALVCTFSPQNEAFRVLNLGSKGAGLKNCTRRSEKNRQHFKLHNF